MKSNQNDFARSGEVKTALDVLRNDTTAYTDEKMRENFKEMNFLVEDKLQALNDLPNKQDYVRRVDFMKFKMNFDNMCGDVERLTDVLLKGYQAEAEHTLKSKVSRTQVEDMISKKFEHERGKDLEKE